jgi:ketosteroid isomerase-like protein
MRSKPVHLWTFLFAVFVLTLLSVGNLPAEDEPPAPCASPVHHQFDFWVGDWDVFDVGSSAKVAHARVDSILDGCVLQENYQATDGHAGKSFTIFDVTRNLWHQTWVTSHGGLLEIEGTLDNGAMVLSGRNQQGALVRGTWKPINGEVREVAVKSNDDGKTWEPWFDLIFRRSANNTSGALASHDTEDDKQIVAALDTRYQAAVKQNDAATMDRILADDFILVTSSGKTYSKSELLNEARSARIIYEHQEDSDKTVRLWGDTAIVTAKLWEKGTDNGKPFEHELWFSDVYRRTPAGWRYVFAQSAYRPSQSLP